MQFFLFAQLGDFPTGLVFLFCAIGIFPGFHQAWDIVWPRQRGVASNWPFCMRNSSLQRLGASASGKWKPTNCRLTQETWEESRNPLRHEETIDPVSSKDFRIAITFFSHFCGKGPFMAPMIPPLRSSMISNDNWSCSYQVFRSWQCRSGWKTSFLKKEPLYFFSLIVDFLGWSDGSLEYKAELQLQSLKIGTQWDIESNLGYLYITIYHYLSLSIYQSINLY